MSHHELQSYTVLVTRPSPAGEVLANQIKQAGGEAIIFPTIEIESLIHTKEVIASIQQLEDSDGIIFISPQSVYQVTDLLHADWPTPPAHCIIVATGEGTANALRQMDWPVHYYPDTHWDSEGVLALPCLQDISDKKWVIISGEGGKNTIPNELSRRGAKVVRVMAYRRVLPNIDVSYYLSLLMTHKLDIIVCTSTEILHNLIYLLGDQALPFLCERPLVVISESMSELAKKIGFQCILRANNASHDAIMKTLKDHVCQTKQKKK